MKNKRDRQAKTPPGAISRVAASKQAEVASTNPNTFPIVGIGASAGGLEALEQFLRHVPKNSGLAIVVVQHLDPTHKGILAELLQRTTEMSVTQITDRTKVEPNRVYVIPPDRDLSILHGILHLLEPAAPRGLRLPVDFFFRSLSDDRQERSIGVILSGMGSDGTLGLRAIKEKAGAVFVQEPTSARFDGMPRSAIEAGLADVIAPVEELPGKIITYLQHIPLLVTTRPDIDLADTEQNGLEKVVLLLRAQTGHDFSHYKTSTIYRRIERRMGLHQLDKIANYVRYLRETPQEAELLFRELLIGVTSFFRDPEAWELVAGEVIPSLLAAHPRGRTLRAWTPGCSTGEEAYSLAILFKEAIERLKPVSPFSLQIFATDLDRDAIAKARAGVYPLNVAADVPVTRLRRFFTQDERGYRVGKEIREMVIFAPQNLVMDPPFTKLDLLTCRNLLIYLTSELQKKLMPLFHYSLNPGGFLFLGSAESIGGSNDLFAPLPGKYRLYRRLETSPGVHQVEFPSAFSRPRHELPAAALPPATTLTAPNLPTLAERLILQRYAPAAVLATAQGDIVYVNGKTGKFLEPAAGKANWNLMAMAREGLSHALHEGFRRAVRQQIPVTIKGAEVGTDGGTQVVDIVIQPLVEPEPLRGMVMVVFTDLAAPPVMKPPRLPGRASADKARLAALENELEQAHEELHSAREEMQTSMEELKSTNEESQSTNEELQSTNEELTTSKEEMQSMNEELQTVNHELQAKIGELTRTGDDMKNLLNSTEIAILFLDGALNVRRFTPQAAGVFKLIPGDAGRPITDIVTALEYGALADDARTVLQSLAVHERQVSARDGRWFAVRIMPYRTQDNRIDGVVITLTDISQAQRLKAELQKVHDALEEQFAKQTAELELERGRLPSAGKTPKETT